MAKPDCAPSFDDLGDTLADSSGAPGSGANPDYIAHNLRAACGIILGL